MTSFFALRMRSDGKAPKNGEPTICFSFMTMLQHNGRFWSKFSKQRTTRQNWSLPHTLRTWFQLIFTCSLDWKALKEKHFCDATDIIKNATEELKRLPGMFPSLSQWLAEVYNCTRRLLWRNCSLIDCIVLYFSEIKWFRGHLEATTYNTTRFINTRPLL